MPGLSKDYLYERIAAGLAEGGASVIHVERASPSPRLFTTRSPDGRVVKARIYIWECTHDRANDSYHFQLTGVRERTFEISRGMTTMILGFNVDRDVFVAADPTRRVAQFGESSSIYTSTESLDEAQRDGLSSHISTRSEVLVNVRQDMLVAYFSAAGAMHTIASTRPGAAEIVRLATEDRITAQPALASASPRERKRIEVVHVVRSASFRPRILRAYGHACGACDLQFGLVEAAHIVPVRDETSDDNTDNGIALCLLHHRAFDKGLLLIHPDLRVEVNNAHVDALRTIGRASKEAAFRSGLRQRLSVPSNPLQRPSAQNLSRGLAIRQALPVPSA